MFKVFFGKCVLVHGHLVRGVRVRRLVEHRLRLDLERLDLRLRCRKMRHDTLQDVVDLFVGHALPKLFHKLCQ